MDKTVCKPVPKGILKPHKSSPHKRTINLLDHPELVAFDDGMYKLEGELRSARRALNECEKWLSAKAVHPLEDPRLVALDEEMRKLAWVLHAGREAVLEQVARHARTKQHWNLVVDQPELTKEEVCHMLRKQDSDPTPKKDQQHDQKTYTSI